MEAIVGEKENQDKDGKIEADEDKMAGGENRI